jgi:hypothetical protein
VLDHQGNLPSLADAPAVVLKEIGSRLQTMVKVNCLNLKIRPRRDRICALAPELEPTQQDGGVKASGEGHQQPSGKLGREPRRIL